jgi:hypothetical protein
MTALLSVFLLGSADGFSDTQAHWQTLWGNQIQYVGIYNYTTDASQARWNRDFPEISSFTNLLFTDPNDPAVGAHLDPQTIVSRMLQSLAMIKAAGKKAILPTDFAFTGAFSDLNRSLSPTFDQEWSTIYKPALAEYADTVVGFYPLDEPFSHMKDQTAEELEHVIATIKAADSFPQWKAIAVFSSGEVNRGVIARATGKNVARSLKTIPKGYDWIGMDCYYPEFNLCGVDVGGEVLPKRSLPQYYSILESLMTPDQQLVLVPTAATYYDPGSIPQELSKYFLMAVSNPRVVAVLNYNYPSDPKKIFDRVGTQSLPAVQKKIQNFSQTYLNNPNPYLPSTTATSNDVSTASAASNAVDGSTDTYYSSNRFTKSTNASMASGGALLDLHLQSPAAVEYVVLKARTQTGPALGFPKRYQVLAQDPKTLKWISEGIFTTQPDTNGLVTLSLVNVRSTSTVRIFPLNFGLDENQNYIFQLAEVGLLGSF